MLDIREREKILFAETSKALIIFYKLGLRILSTYIFSKK